MRNCILSGLRIEMRRQLLAGDAMKLRQEVLDGCAGGIWLVASYVQLDAVAGRHDRGLAMHVRACQRRQRAIDTTSREVEPLSKLDRCGAMANADQKQLHVRSYAPS